jgi:putative transposase
MKEARTVKPAQAQHTRRSIRLKGHDYSQPGAYFVTVCTQDRACLFGEVADGEMRLNPAGQLVERGWCAIPDHFPLARLDAFVVMPNHAHGIIVLSTVRATHASRPHHPAPPGRPRGPQRHSIGAIVGSFKSAVTKNINASRGTPGAPVWQRNYYEHVVRDEGSLNRIRQYILDNPAQWAMDRDNPLVVAAAEADAWRR